MDESLIWTRSLVICSSLSGVCIWTYSPVNVTLFFIFENSFDLAPGHIPVKGEVSCSCENHQKPMQP